MPLALRPSAPKVQVSADGIAKIANIDQKFDHGVGFSNGCAELTLKKPPPLVPSCLIAIWLATGPIARICFAPSSVVTLDVGLEVLDHALLHQDQRHDEGERQQDVERAADQVGPEVPEPALARRGRAMPRISAMASAMPDRGRDEVVEGELASSARSTTSSSRPRTTASWCWW